MQTLSVYEVLSLRSKPDDNDGNNSVIVSEALCHMLELSKLLS